VIGTAARQWHDDLQAWAIPDAILQAADRSPWGHSVRRFAARADADLAHPGGASYAMAVAALEPYGGTATLLDVGAGAGAASLPLAPWTSRLTAVDTQRGMLDALAERAAARDLDVRLVEGRWPVVADEVEVHDVVVCHHVLYDVADVGPFLVALTDRARGRVVVEMTERHPMQWLNPLWLHFHDLERPVRPTADDLVPVLLDTGVAALAVEHSWREQHEALDEPSRVAQVTRFLCLPVEREPEVAEQLRRLGPDQWGPSATTRRQRVVTLAWAGRGGTDRPT
jgi:hypothetical protein